MITEIINWPLTQKITALYTLIRVIPVLTWGISSSLVGIGFAYKFDSRINWLDYSLIVLLIFLVHGIASHAFNDREDWLSGTDQLSPGILSGGSGVIARGQYSIQKLSWIGKTAILLALVAAGYFVMKVGILVLIFPIIGMGAAVAYSCPPFKLSYHPLAGEWLCAFPAVTACAAGTFYVLTGNIQPVVLISGGINALLAMGLLMHHHISDVSSDLQAIPQKLTTTALVGITLGMKKTPLAAAAYFLLALLGGLAGGLFFQHIFWITVPTALGCIAASLTADTESIMSITRGEYCIYLLIIGDAIFKTAWLFV
jgi:1,4-dihydroxy-2-naphthoate octaprenyltransferase